MGKLEDKLETLIKEKNRVVLAIDGMCASGKTLFASKLSEKYDGTVIHCDDFFLPPDMRTPKRYKEPGGNIHYERLKTEVIDKLQSKGGFSYGRFDCKKMAITEEVIVPDKKLVIVEGAYSMHPFFGKYYDMSLFMRVSTEEQEKRIVSRNQDLKVFREKWMPLEREYFIYMGIEEKADLTILSEHDFVLNYT
ncbi:MAG: uridine kinase [Lachnospiraceae bacterium]|nr:uridine kinase [Lachnospiraceae bacterium]